MILRKDSGLVARTIKSVLAASLLTLVAACGNGDSDLTYVAIGASDAVGIGASTPNQGYVFELTDSLETELMKDVGLINLGIPAAEADEIENVAVPVAENSDPDLITIWVGANDLVGGRSASDFEADLRSILAQLSGGTDAEILIANLPMLTELPTFQMDPDSDVTAERVDRFNAIIAQAAADFGATLVDISDLGENEALISGDGFHPSEEGHKLLSQRFLAAALAVLPPPDNGMTENSMT